MASPYRFFTILVNGGFFCFQAVPLLNRITHQFRHLFSRLAQRPQSLNQDQALDSLPKNSSDTGSHSCPHGMPDQRTFLPSQLVQNLHHFKKHVHKMITGSWRAVRGMPMPGHVQGDQPPIREKWCKVIKSCCVVEPSMKSQDPESIGWPPCFCSNLK